MAEFGGRMAIGRVEKVLAGATNRPKSASANLFPADDAVELKIGLEKENLNNFYYFRTVDWQM